MVLRGGYASVQDNVVQFSDSIEVRILRNARTKMHAWTEVTVLTNDAERSQEIPTVEDLQRAVINRKCCCSETYSSVVPWPT